MTRRVEGGLCAPKGFTAAAVAAGIKNPTKPRLDCALVVSETTASVAGTFTTNKVKAACVRWNDAVCKRGTARALFVNSGNANACTGEQGEQDTHDTAARVAAQVGCPIEDVLVASTGVIGVPLPMERLLEGVNEAAGKLTALAGIDAARAIMTTDTMPKEIAVEVELDDGPVRIGAIAKGAGMIAPNMATMLCFITTDAAIHAQYLQPLLGNCVAHTFNRICVDNDTSTNDMCLCLANGMAANTLLEPGTDDFGRFGKALREVCLSMAHALVRDGEGVTKFVTIHVEGAADDDDALKAARAIAQSQLCKTAFAGQDPNWGRITCAAGYSGADVDPKKLALWLGDIQVLAEGVPTGYAEADAAAHMQRPEVAIRLRVGDGPGTCTFWTSDLTHDYVTINADYRT